MALLWKKTVKGSLYEVRTSGSSIRLYTDGVFHSSYNPRNPVTGNAWDLLMLPAFFYPDCTVKNILVLGVGGGAVIHLLNKFIQPDSIIGIEINKTHIVIAKRFFNLRYKNLKLVHADAIDWLKKYQGPAFDMIIDDLFIEDSGEPVAAIGANTSWFTLMLKHLNREGVIVKNFTEHKDFNNSSPVKNKTMKKRFKSLFSFSVTHNENLVAAYLTKTAESSYLRKRLVETPALNPRLKTSRLRYRIRKVT